MVHPDIMEALRLVTRHAGAAHADKVFGPLLNKPTPGAGIDEGTKHDVLTHDINTGVPEAGDPKMPYEGSELEESGETPGEEQQEPIHGMGFAKTIEHAPPMKEPPMMSASELPRRKGGWPKGKARKGK